MKTPQALDSSGTGAQHKVIRVAQNALGPGRPDSVSGHRFDGPGGADGHERWGFNLSVCGLQHTGPCPAVGGNGLKVKA
jgi:hypothetical protein